MRQYVVIYKEFSHLGGDIRNLTILLLLSVTHILSAQCVDDVTGAFAGVGGCAQVINVFQVSCNTEFAGTLVSDECPLSCNTCPGVCDDGVCSSDETSVTCPGDCPVCDGTPACLNILNVDANAGAGTFDIHMVNQIGCTYFDGITPIFDTTIDDAPTCAGVCTNSLDPTGTIVSEFLNEFPCIDHMATFNGLCSDPQYNWWDCEDNGGTWENNTWTDSEIDGYFFDGNVAGFQFVFSNTSMTNVSVTGGSALDADFTVLTQPNFDFDGPNSPGVYPELTMIVGFQSTSETIPAGEGALVTIAFTGYTGDAICFYDQDCVGGGCLNLIADAGGEAAPTDWGDCYTPSDDYVLGDVTGDGQVDVLDVVALVNAILEGTEIINGDVNLDNEVNVLDVVALVYIILNP